ncbi:AMP-binding protein [Streptomyces sp. SID4920]|nr:MULTISPECIES: AMP-dependent synthetase/ligase [unclassified Streptomyces]MYS32887.1 AMP-binding protein [Streptomyces sp. SID4920]MYX64633.1 AMP-binding protein [Streptomyces sp. SID8373]
MAAQASARATCPAVSWKRSDGTVATLTWAAYRELVLDAASALLYLGLRPAQTVAVLAGNRVEHLVADLAASHCGAASVSLYPTFSAEQLEYVVADAEPGIIIVEAGAAERIASLPWVRNHRPHLITLPQEQGDQAVRAPGAPTTWPELLGTGARLRTELVHEIERRSGALGDSSPLTYVYTSGTTGTPKGVILTHRNLLWGAEALERTGSFDYDYRVVSALPLAHVVERLWSLYLALYLGGHVWCCPDSRDLLASLRRHRPSYFMAVPRTWEKLQQGMEAYLASPALAGRHDALEADRHTLAAQWKLVQDDAAVPAALKTAAQLAREGVLRDVRHVFGLDRTLVAATGAAPMRSDVVEFFASLGIPVQQGYGLTESGGVAVAERGDVQGSGSVGLPLPGVAVRIAPDGEIEIRSPGNTPGYRNSKEATANLYTGDGWLRSGDIGRLDQAGRLHITERKKEILVNASGKNIAPTGIESLIAGRLFIDQVMVVGEGRPYVVALLTVDPAVLTAFAHTRGIPAAATEDLLRHPAVRGKAQTIVDQANALLSRPEQIKRFTLLPAAWSVEAGELTPTLKMRRKIIGNRYRTHIEALYGRP